MPVTRSLRKCQQKLLGPDGTPIATGIDNSPAMDRTTPVPPPTWESENAGNKQIEEPIAGTSAQPAEKSVQKRSSEYSWKSKKDQALKIAQAKEKMLRIELELATARIAFLEAEAEAEDIEDGTDTVVSENEQLENKVGTWFQKNDQVCTEIAPTTTKEDSKPLPSSTNINLTELASAIALAARSGPQTSRYMTELPIFCGSHQDWLSFKAAFNESASSLPEVENIARLRRSLRGRAKEAVENLLIYNAETRTIMQALESRFGRPDVIALAELDRLRSLPRPTDSPRDICIFASRVSNTVATLRTLNRSHYLYSPEAMKAIIEKLTPTMRYRWFDYAAEQKQEEPELMKISRFLDRESERCGPYAQPESTQYTEIPNRRIQKTYVTVSKPSSKCLVCSADDHTVYTCKQFIETDIHSRWEIAKKYRLCYACLKYKSKSHNCKKIKCLRDGCERYHNKLLHFTRVTETEDGENIEKSETVTSTWTSKQTTSSYLKIIPVRISGPSGNMDTYALLDDGSTITLIDEEIAQKIGATGPIDPLKIEAFASHKISESKSRRVTVTLHSGNQQHKIRANTIENIKLSPQTISEKELEGCSHLRGIQKTLQYQYAIPKILIGQDNWNMLLATEVRRGRKDQPVASLTPLGWVLHGTYTKSLEHQVNFTSQFVNHLSTCEETMDEELKRYFAIESLFIEPKQPQSDPNERALKKLESGIKQTEDGHYEVPLLWKNDDVTMPDNYDNTLKRLWNLERKLDKDSHLKMKYTEQIDQLIEKGYAEPAPPLKNNSKTWYLPHFAVLNPMKPGKVRIVHDAAAKTKGMSLNHHLMTGPDLLQSLPGVLMRFRQYPVAVCADIKEMFMRVKIAPQDRDALRYLWRGERRDDKPPEEYRMTSLIFGATCSPSIAIYVKNINAKKYEKQYPEAASAIIRNHYVDDYLQSFRTQREAIEIAQQVRNIHSYASYELRQWASNSPQVKEALEPNYEQKPEVDLNNDSKIERVLGLKWTPSLDELTFNLDLSRLSPTTLENEEPTKREILKIMMSVFDPLGLAALITGNARAILQEVWRRGTDWDEKIDRDLAMKWKIWIENLKRLRTISIPRSYPNFYQAKSLQLHTFVDASETAYAACLYWRIVTPNDEICVSLIAAKTKVAPLKMTSIPRLELQAATMGARMATVVIDEHDVKPERKYFWTDSKTVLTWLKTGARSYKPFVAHRIASIEENSTVNEWRWIPTKLNVADDGTRDVPQDLDHNHRWFSGPQFLRNDPSNWPIENSSLDTNTGEEKVNQVQKIQDRIDPQSALPDYTRFSKWERLLRTTARVLQFTQLCRQKTQKVTYRKRTMKNEQDDPDWRVRKRRTTAPEKERNIVRKTEITENTRNYLPIAVTFLQQAEQLLIKRCQQESFYEEIQDMLHNRVTSNKNRLQSISTVLVDGIVTIRSRISAVENIPTNMKQPAVLDGNHYITKLYIEYIHRQLQHAGVEATINECRQNYWIIRLRPVTRMIIHRCLKCRIKKATPPEPATGDLPSCRLAHHQRPFSFTGLDYFGPLSVTVNRTRQKRYVALFTCMTTRAVHLELATTLNADSAVMALKRMIARRGCPTEIWSDNGTNFHGADKELRAAINSALEEEGSKRFITWRFIPPGAPFMGGAWERMVRTVKVALNAILNERYPTEEVLTTLLAEVEFTVNSRPLTHVSVDPNDPEALTPNHFLLLGTASTPQYGTFTDNDLIGRTHWRASQRLADMFWSRWIKEYLPSLQNRRVPHGKGRALKTGDVVLVVDNTLPRNTWPMGIVTVTYPGGDGVVRTADVRIKGNILRRPTKKLVIISTEPAAEHL